MRTARILAIALAAIGLFAFAVSPAAHADIFLTVQDLDTGALFFSTAAGSSGLIGTGTGVVPITLGNFTIDISATATYNFQGTGGKQDTTDISVTNNNLVTAGQHRLQITTLSTLYGNVPGNVSVAANAQATALTGTGSKISDLAQLLDAGGGLVSQDLLPDIVGSFQPPDIPRNSTGTLTGFVSTTSYQLQDVITLVLDAGGTTTGSFTKVSIVGVVPEPGTVISGLSALPILAFVSIAKRRRRA